MHVSFKLKSIMLSSLSREHYISICKIQSINTIVNIFYNRTCRGRGTVSNTVKESINIPKGVDTGVNLRISKKGNFSPNGPPGDLMV